MSDSHKRITGLYRDSSDLGLNSRQVMTRLIGMLVLNLEHAKNAHALKKLEAMTEYNRKSLRIIAVIRVALQNEYVNTDETHVLQLAAYLRRLYQDIYIRLANVLLGRDPQAEFDSFLAVLREQYRAWKGKEPENGAEAAVNPETMAAAPPAGHAKTGSAAAQDFYA